MDILGALGFPRSKKGPPLFKPRSRSFSLPENRFDPTEASFDISFNLCSVYTYIPRFTGQYHS